MCMRKNNYGNGEEPRDPRAEAFENIQQINRELLVASLAEIPDEAAAALERAREYVLVAVALSRTNDSHPLRSPEELPVSEYKALRSVAERKFEPLFEVLRFPEPRRCELMPSKLDGRRKRRHYGCF